MTAQAANIRQPQNPFENFVFPDPLEKCTIYQKAGAYTGIFAVGVGTLYVSAKILGMALSVNCIAAMILASIVTSKCIDFVGKKSAEYLQKKDKKETAELVKLVTRIASSIGGYKVAQAVAGLWGPDTFLAFGAAALLSTASVVIIIIVAACLMPAPPENAPSPTAAPQAANITTTSTTTQTASLIAAATAQ